jgi:predicted outer membrane repeat protein
LDGLTITGSSESAISNSGANFSVSNTNFINNTANTGGAIYNDGYINVNNANFINNTVVGYIGGGAINTIGGCNMSSNVSFINNTAMHGDGGAIRAFGFGNFINDVNFINNQASGSAGGGAIHTSYGVIIVSNVNFTNNRNSAISNMGAAINISNNVNFINNTAIENRSGGGGAIRTMGAAGFSISNNVTFINNTATGSGGAIFNQVNEEYRSNGADFSISNNVSFINNKATDGVTDGVGGAISNGDNLWNYGGANFNVNNNVSFINNTANSGGAIDNGGANFNVNNNVSFIDNTANSGGAIDNDGANFNVNNVTFINNTIGAISNSAADSKVIGCDIVGNIGDGIYNNGNDVIINYNRIVNNTGYGLNTTTGINADFNWWGTNNITNAGIIGVNPLNSYFVIQLSANDNNYTRNATVSGSLPVSLAYDMVLNSTNKSDNSSKLPDFNTTIKLTGLPDNSTKAIEPWDATLTNIGEYNFTAICDNENLNINLTVTHPVYDLSLRNEPSGQVYMGAWINSIATAIGDTPLNDDYCIFKVTSPSADVKWSDHKSFNGIDSEPYQWQLTEKGRYLVEVWAYDKDGNHVKVPDSTSRLFKPNVMKPFREYITFGAVYGDSISKVQSNALEVINVE